MKRTLAACAVLILLGAACGADNSSSIEIDGRAAPDNVPSCKFSATGEFLLGPGVLDVGLVAQPTYHLVVYVKNNLLDPAASNPSNLTSARIWNGYAARVRVDPTSYVEAFGPNPPLPATSLQNTNPLTGQAVQPAGGTSALGIEAVSGTLGAQLATLADPTQIKTLVLGITLLGKTGEGASVDSAEWFFPLKLCSGCLTPPATCPTGQVLTATNCFAPWQDSAAVCAAAAQ